MISKIVFIIIIKLKKGKNTKSSKTNSLNQKRKTIKYMGWVCKPPVLRDSRCGGAETPRRKEMWAPGTTARARRWRVTSSCLLTEEKKSPVRHICPGSAHDGPSILSASENGPGSQESRGVPETRAWESVGQWRCPVMLELSE